MLSLRSSGQVEITIILANRVADRNGRTIHALETISEPMNSAASVARTRSREEKQLIGDRAPRSYLRFAAHSPILLKDCLHLALPDGTLQCRMIFVVLVSIGDGERCYGS